MPKVRIRDKYGGGAYFPVQEGVFAGQAYRGEISARRKRVVAGTIAGLGVATLAATALCGVAYWQGLGGAYGARAFIKLAVYAMALGIPACASGLIGLRRATDHILQIDAGGIRVQRGQHRYEVHWQDVKEVVVEQSVPPAIGRDLFDIRMGVRLASGIFPLARAVGGGPARRTDAERLVSILEHWCPRKGTRPSAG